MTLEEKLQNFGVSDEFIKIALLYKDDYNPEVDLEVFVEYVEEKHALVEAQEFDEALKKKAEKLKNIKSLADIFQEDLSDDAVNKLI